MKPISDIIFELLAMYKKELQFLGELAVAIGIFVAFLLWIIIAGLMGW